MDIRKHTLALALGLAFMGISSASAHDFEAIASGQKLYFTIVDTVKATAIVSYEGSIASTHCAAKGVVEVPEKVKNGAKTYTIIGIGAKAFAGATRLTGIVLPPSITAIGDFAFDGCTSLSQVLMPARQVKVAEGSFFRCPAIAHITFGSDWQTIDFKPFRWSDSLTVVTIPAKVAKVHNLKALKHLKRVDVDANNSHFAAADGLLYNRQMTTLYAVPRGVEGSITIKEGTETITFGALIDCFHVTEIDFPQSVKQLSFRETAHMKNLKSVSFHGKKPLETAYQKGKPFFLLQTANADVKIFMPKEAKKAYAEAMPTATGEFTDKPEAKAMPYTVETSQMPKIKQLQALKK